VHFGGGSDEEMGKLKKQIDSLPGNIKVTLQGPTPNAKILEYYATGNVRLVINLSIAEGLPVSLMEAVSYAIPVIATQVYGSPEVANAVSGYSIPVEFNDADVALLIDDLNNNRLLWGEKSRGAKQLFLENFTAERNFKDFINALQQIRG
jgi:glycosyltransferase involved in cell wall biosynthesis